MDPLRIHYLHSVSTVLMLLRADGVGFGFASYGSPIGRFLGRNDHRHQLDRSSEKDLDEVLCPLRMHQMNRASVCTPGCHANRNFSKMLIPSSLRIGLSFLATLCVQGMMFFHGYVRAWWNGLVWLQYVRIHTLLSHA